MSSSLSLFSSRSVGDPDLCDESAGEPPDVIEKLEDDLLTVLSISKESSFGV